MSKNVLDEFDKNQAEKSNEEEAVVEAPQADTPAPEPEAKPEAPKEEPKGAVGEVGLPGTPAPAPEPEVATEAPKEPEAQVAEPEVAEKDADENSDAAPSPKPFEKGGKVGEKDADPNGGNAELLSALTSAFTGNFETVQKSLGENQQSIAQLTETVSAVNKQLAEIRELVTSGFATKAEEPEAEAVKAEPKDKEAEKADKSKAKDEDDEDCDDKNCKDKKGDKDKDSKKDAEKSLDEEVPVAEPVPDEPLYVAEKSAAIGSPVSEVAPEVEETQEEATKSLSEQYVAARGKLGDFNDKLIAEAQVGAITRADYAEKSMLADDIAYGREITQEKLDEFVGYIK